MERMQLAIGRLLLVGVLVSFVIVIVGGGVYLFKHSADIVNYHSFQGEPQIYTSLVDVLHDAFTLSSRGLIQLGLLILVIVQIARVGMTSWLFFQAKDKFFTCISLFIFFALMYSLIFRF